MVPGIDSFRDKFKDYSDYYTIIGGTACDILLSEADLPFRATKDIDMILIMEDNFPEFAAIFWEYIKEGGYKCGWKNEDNMHFYRFTEGKFGYPTMIELFSRKPGYHLEIEEGIIPIHIDDDTSSLSAILLNDDFYKFMMVGRRVVDGIGVLGAEHEVAEMFRSIIEDRPQYKTEKIVAGYSGFLFLDKDGMPLVAMHWEHRFNSMVGRYNEIYKVQMPNITPHVCRHTYCSNQAKAGMNPKTLQYLMGHSDIAVTLNVYTHVGLEDAENELRKMKTLEGARKEMGISDKDDKPLKQTTFKVV